MLIKIHPDNPSEKQIQKVVDCLQRGGIVIFPTDTVYGMACSIKEPKTMDKIALIKGKKKTRFSFVFKDLSHISDYTKPFKNTVFKLMKSTLPGPYTYILEANNNIPKIMQSKKKTIGIRVPNNNIATEIVRLLGNPIITTSVTFEDEVPEYTSNPELIHEKYQKIVDLVIDAGNCELTPSTIVDCTGNETEVIRTGKGIL